MVTKSNVIEPLKPVSGYSSSSRNLRGQQLQNVALHLKQKNRYEDKNSTRMNRPSDNYETQDMDPVCAIMYAEKLI